MRRFLLSHYIFVLLSAVLISGAGNPSFASDTAPSANTQIQSLFNNLEIAGNAYNAGGGGAAFNEALSSGCSALSGSQEMQDSTAHLFSGMFGGGHNDSGSLFGQAAGYGNRLGQQAANQLLGGACSALSGSGSSQLSGSMMGDLQQQLQMGLTGGVQTYANKSGLPFLSRLEIETGTERKEWVSSITTIQPLWHDQDRRNHVFTQLAWRTVDGENTLNTGLAYRYLNPEKTVLYGLNAFFDHAFKMNHNRASIGADMQTSLWGVAFNKYIPLSGWRVRDYYWEEKAAGGVDLEVHGQVPSLPSWTASLKAYQWDGSDQTDKDPNDPPKNTLGYLTSLEYAPFSALALRAGLRRENNDLTSGEMALRFNMRLDQPWDMQFKPRLELASVEDRVYQKVSRENTIRVQVRRRDSAYLSVLQTNGINTISGQPGILSLMQGQSLIIPATLSVANTAGAVVRLQFSDGAILTAAQGTQVTIEADKITLISGTAQYTSGGIVRVVNVPGATITLLGTDIDMSSNGTTSNVRVREGSVIVTGLSSGAITLGQAQMASSVSGVVSTVAINSAPYIAYTDQVSTQIDRVATPVAGGKVAPYPNEAPKLLSTSTTPGQAITIGLKFNTAVTATGGTPRLNLTINGNARTANLSSGSGTNTLVFSYTLQATDAGATSLTVNSFDMNGATISGEGKAAITTIADTVLDLTGTIDYVASLTMDFLSQTYSLLGTTYNSFAGFLTAASGTFSRASVGAYFDATGALKMAAANTPRFDYDPVTHAAKGLLIEESRTNYAINNDDFTQWITDGVTISTDGTLGPDGQTPAVLVTMPSLSPGNRLIGLAHPTSPGTYVMSVYAKAGTATNGAIGVDFASPNQSFTFDLSNPDGVNVIPVGNGWFRILMTTVQSGSSSMYVNIGFNGANGRGAGDSMYFANVQYEKGSFVTSYIPTTSSIATRAADSLTFPTGSWFDATQGTSVAAVNVPLLGGTGVPGTVAFDDSTANNSINHSITASSGATLSQIKRAGGTEFSQNGPVYTAGAVLKTAIAYQQDNTVAASNGTLGTIDLNVTLPTVSTLRVGCGAGGCGTTQSLNGYVRTYGYYPGRLPDARMQTMTAP